MLTCLISNALADVSDACTASDARYCLPRSNMQACHWRYRHLSSPHGFGTPCKTAIAASARRPRQVCEQIHQLRPVRRHLRQTKVCVRSLRRLRDIGRFLHKERGWNAVSLYAVRLVATLTACTAGSPAKDCRKA